MAAVKVVTKIEHDPNSITFNWATCPSTNNINQNFVFTQTNAVVMTGLGKIEI